MAQPPRIGTLKISVDGSWDIEDLRVLAESFSETYALFYPLVPNTDEINNVLHSLIRRQFWSGDIETQHFGRLLYRQIPSDESLKIKSFHYSSPGVLELVGVLPVLYLAAHVARAWIKTGDEFISLWEKVEKFFTQRRDLRKPRKTIELDDKMALGSDEARALVFEVGPRLGFTEPSCERIIEIAGNPISALKLIVAIGREGRRVATLQQQGLLELPPTPNEVDISANPSKALTRGIVRVERKKTRRQPRRS